MTQITFNALDFCFPKDTMWMSAGAEIVGYSPSTNLHIVISDGCCIGESWSVHIYEPNNAEKHKRDWTHPYPTKHLSDELALKWVEEYVNFDSLVERIRFREIVNNIPVTLKEEK